MKHNRYALTLLFGILLCCFSNRTFSQIVITADPSSCGDTSIILHGVLTGDVPTASGITSDDGYSGAVNIGFTFNFYGNNFTQVCIGSNGLVTMGASMAGAYCTWPISSSLATSTACRNSIAGPWSDICTPCATPGGTITYSTIGSAPYRKFMVTYCKVHMFGCTTQYETFQIIMYETTNICETHIAHRTFAGCTWNGPYAIVGVENAAGTASTAAPGRDYPAMWGCTNEAWRFSPTGTTTTSPYTCTPITFAPVPYASSTIYWYDSATGAYIGSGSTLSVHPTVPTTYVATAAGCSDSTFAYIHVLPVSSGGGTLTAGSHPVHITSLITSNPTQCGLCNGSVTLTGVNPFFVDTVFYSIGGVAQPIIIDSAHSDSTLTISNLCPGSYDYFYVKEGTCVSNAIPTTLSAPPIVIRLNSTNPTECGRCNGTVTLIGAPPYAADTIFYSIGGVPQTPIAATAAGDSTLQVLNLCAGVYDYFYVKQGNCVSNSIPVTLTTVAPVAAFTFTTHLGCGGDTIVVTNTSTPAGYTSVFSYGDGTIDSSSANPTYVYHTQGAFTVGLLYHNAYGCSDIATLPLTLTHAVTSSFTPSAPTVCLGAAITFNNTSTSTSTPTYFWSFGDGLTSTAMSPTHTYAAPGDYSVTLNVTDNIPCTATSSVPVRVIQVTASTDFHDTTVCLLDSMRLVTHVSVIPASVPLTYTWTPATNLGNPNVAQPNFYGIGDFTYSFTAAAMPYGCASSDALTIHHNPPTSVFAPSASAVCLGVPIAFTNSSTGNGITYAWAFGDGYTTTDLNPTHVYAAGGDYTVQLVVTDSLNCVRTSNTSVQVVSITTRTEFHDTTVCLALPLGLQAYTTVVPSYLTAVTYQWTPGTYLSDPTIENPFFSIVTGNYTYTFTATVAPLNCTATDVLTIHSQPPIVLSHVTVDQTIPIGSSVQLNADSGWIYVWSPNNGTLDNPNINNPVATPTDSVTTYMVVAMSPNGCRDSASVTIRVDPSVTEFIPEAFTPNGDGLNDVFRVFNLGQYQKLVDFRIFNRWGKEVFQTINPKQGWDGTINGVPQDMGTYFYQIIVAHPDGKQKSISGNVTLIR